MLPEDCTNVKLPYPYFIYCISAFTLCFLLSPRATLFCYTNIFSLRQTNYFEDENELSSRDVCHIRLSTHGTLYIHPGAVISSLLHKQSTADYMCNTSPVQMGRICQKLNEENRARDVLISSASVDNSHMGPTHYQQLKSFVTLQSRIYLL